LAGPSSLVISQLHTRLGASATSSGFTVGGWVAWRRRSATSPAARKTRYMVAIEAR
jgi:hypothetical protein